LAQGAATVTLSPSSLIFGTQLKGTTSAAQTVTLTNTGNASLSLTSIRGSAFFTDTTTCQATLAAGASCTISVSFAPGQNGTVTGSISVSDNASGSPQTVALSGSGTIISLSPATVTFASQSVGTSSPAQAITLTNVGSSVLKISSVTMQGANPGDFSQTNTCVSVTAGGTCSINVTFKPTVAGTRTASLTVGNPCTRPAPRRT
jgi:hypothetical protein